VAQELALPNPNSVDRLVLFATFCRIWVHRARAMVGPKAAL
jgi:hypothetical protein